ncbi:nitroreductase [Thermoplasmatales archaeon SG8-52-1]|nr:MAG: nitroreductase [Thermoplasmatales archaeon SG8-52-1]
MDVYKTIISRRSIRRFQQKEIPIELLKKFVNAARLAPSAANLQPLEFFIVDDKKLCEKIFETVSWAAYITPKWAPSEGERPVAYIINLIKDTNNKWSDRDVSLASENIVLAAEEQGIGSCIMCKIDKIKIQEILKIPKHIIVDSVIALGYKAEKSVIEDYTDTVKYWRDENQVLHVPKRKLKDIIHINKF